MYKGFTQRLSLVCALLLASSFFLLGQEVVTEWQSPPGAQAVSIFQDGLIPRSNMLDYNGDGINELTGITNNGVFRIVDGATQQVLAQAGELAGVPLAMYRFFGFADMAGSEEKELTFVPRIDLENNVIFTEINSEFGTLEPGTQLELAFRRSELSAQGSQRLQ